MVVPSDSADRVLARVTELGDRAFRIGEVVRVGEGDQQVAYVD